MISKIKAVFELIGFYFFGGVWLARRKGVRVGDGCRIYITSWGSEPFLISIGDRVTITSGVRLVTHDGATWLVRTNGVRHQKYLPIDVGDDVFLGTNAIVMPGVTVGSRVIVAAGAVVTKDIPSNSVAAGVPARVIGSFDAYAAKVTAQCPLDSELSGVYEARVRQAVDIHDQRRS